MGSQLPFHVLVGWRTEHLGVRDRLQDAEEVYEILFLFLREPNSESAIVEVHEFGQIASGTVGEVGCASGESPELSHQDGANIRTFSGEECTAGVLSQEDPAELWMRRSRRVARYAEQRQLGRFLRGRQIRCADVERAVDSGPVAGGAGAPPAVWQAELTRSEQVDTTQDRFAKSALADGEIGLGEIAPWIE